VLLESISSDKAGWGMPSFFNYLAFSETRKVLEEARAHTSQLRFKSLDAGEASSALDAYVNLGSGDPGLGLAYPRSSLQKRELATYPCTVGLELDKPALNAVILYHRGNATALAAQSDLVCRLCEKGTYRGPEQVKCDECAPGLQAVK
ncbi:unnamed protein product, partial [Polarella glacialis]